MEAPPHRSCLPEEPGEQIAQQLDTSALPWASKALSQAISVIRRQTSKLRDEEAVSLRSKDHFGCCKQELVEQHGNTYWTSLESMEGFSDLPEPVRESCYVLERAGCEIGNYVAFDCKNKKLCICQQSFAESDPYFDPGTFPFDVVQIPHLDGPGDFPGVLSTEKEQEILAVMEKHYRVLMAPNVVLFHPSATMRVNGELIAEPCVRIVVWAKGYVPLGSWLLPELLDGIPIDVVEGPPLRFSYNPASINAAKRSAGPMYTGQRITMTSEKGRFDATFGGVVQDRSTGNKYGLTCGHFLETHPPDTSIQRGANMIVGQPRPPFVVPAPKSPEELGSKSMPVIHDDVHNKDSKVDCGLFILADGIIRSTSTTTLDPSLLESFNAFGVDKVPKLIGPPDVLRTAFTSQAGGIFVDGDMHGRGLLNDAVVYKQGAQTGLTKGRAARSCAQILYGWIDHCPLEVSKSYYVCNCQGISITGDGDDFSKQGESGSLVITPDGASDGYLQVAGLLFASQVRSTFARPTGASPYYSLACFFEDVEERLNVRLVV